MIIDIHSHVGPVIKDKRLRYVLDTHPAPAAENYIAAMDKAGIRMGVTFGFLAMDNEYQARIQKKYPDRIISFAFLNPRNPNAVGEFKHCVEDLGLRGLKIHGWWHGVSSADHILLNPLCQICDEHNLPILIHTLSDNFLTTPLQLEEMAKSFPNVTFIMGHAGGLWLYHEALLVTKRTKNIVIDTAAVEGYWIAKFVEEIGPERVAMGSDFPWNHLESIVKTIEVAVPDPKAREWVMGKTAAKVLGIRTEMV